VGTKLRSFSLDSNSSLLPGSEQRQWLERQIDTLPSDVRFVVITLHHPPVADKGAAAPIDTVTRPFLTFTTSASSYRAST
jgi:hypothetical protein